MEDKPLSQNEAKLAADFLKQNGKSLKSGYVVVWRVRPSEIAKTYKISLYDLLVAIRRGS